MASKSKDKKQLYYRYSKATTIHDHYMRFPVGIYEILDKVFNKKDLPEPPKPMYNHTWQIPKTKD